MKIYTSMGVSIVAPTPGGGGSINYVDYPSNDTYNGYIVYYNDLGTPSYRDENGNRRVISDVENIVKDGALQTPEETPEEIPEETPEETPEENEEATPEENEEETPEETPEETTGEDITNEEDTTEDETETTEISTEDIKNDIVYETAVEVPFLDKPLDEYNTTEGLLFCTLVLTAIMLVVLLLKD